MIWGRDGKTIENNLAEVNNFGGGIVFGIKPEGGVREAGLLEIADVDGRPSFLLLHANLRGYERLLADGNVHLADVLLACGRQMNDKMAVLFLHSIRIAVLVHVDEIVGVDGCQLRFRGVGDIYLVVLLDIGPLCLTVEPDNGLRRGGMELTAFNGQRTAGVHVITLDGKTGLSALLDRDSSSTLVKYLLGGLCRSGKQGKESH